MRVGDALHGGVAIVMSKSPKLKNICLTESMLCQTLVWTKKIVGMRELGAVGFAVPGASGMALCVT